MSEIERQKRLLMQAMSQAKNPEIRRVWVGHWWKLNEKQKEMQKLQGGRK